MCTSKGALEASAAPLWAEGSADQLPQPGLGTMMESFSNISGVLKLQNYPECLLMYRFMEASPGVPDSAGLGWVLRSCISDSSSGHADVIWGPHLESHGWDVSEPPKVHDPQI